MAKSVMVQYDFFQIHPKRSNQIRVIFFPICIIKLCSSVSFRNKTIKATDNIKMIDSFEGIDL